MKIASYLSGTTQKLGIVEGDRIFALDQIDPGLPRTLEALLEAGTPLMEVVWSAPLHDAGEPLASVKLLPPLRNPRKFLGIGLNYVSHVEELRARGRPVPDLANQIWFNKQTSCITGPRDPIHLPSVSEELDFEGELAVVIGRRCRHIAREDARKVIAGYMVANDISVRDWQARAPTATLGKSFDTHGPIGPWLTTPDEIADPEALAIRTTVDGVTMQDGNTRDLVNGIDAMIAYLTTVMTLEPGDILATGTPCGTAAGRSPPPWLRAGQTVRVEIERLGYLENQVIAEPLAKTRSVL